MYFDVPLAVTIFAMPKLLTNFWQSWTYRKHQLPPRFTVLFAGGGGIGAGIGTVLLANLPGNALTMTVAFAVLAYWRFGSSIWVGCCVIAWPNGLRFRRLPARWTMGVVQVPMLVGYGLLDWKRFILSMSAIIPVLAFMPAGAWLARRIPPAVFDKIILVLLAGIALRLILQAWA